MKRDTSAGAHDHVLIIAIPRAVVMRDSLIPARRFPGHLGFPVTSEWHPWFGDADAGGSRVAAGYATSYGAPAKDFSFVTVKVRHHTIIPKLFIA